MNKPDWTLGVLLGGQSRRMGQDKALLKVAETTLVEFTIQNCRGDNTPVILGVGNKDRCLPESLHRFSKVHDRESDGGPLFGIQALVDMAQTTWLVIIPCDMPGLSLAILDDLLADLDHDDDFAQFRTAGTIQILPLAVKVTWAKAEISKTLDLGERRIVNFLRNGRGKIKTWNDAHDCQRAFHNINTQSEFHAFVKLKRNLEDDEGS